MLQKIKHHVIMKKIRKGEHVMKIRSYFWRRAICLTLQKHLKNKRKSHNVYVVKGRPKTGFFSNYFYSIGHAMLAKKYGYDFVIDWQNYVTPYNETYPINGTKNCWEYFFKQPLSLDDITKQNPAAYVSEDKYPYSTVPHYGTNNIGKEGFPKKSQIKRINDFVELNCPLKEDIKQEFDKLSLNLDLKNCLGIHIRGTDMNNTKGHNKPAKLASTISKIKETLNILKLDKIFLCTDEQKIRDKLLLEFGNKIQTLDVYRSTNGIEGIHLETTENNRENHKYLLGYEVLRDAYLLGQCDSLVCGKSNVAYAAIVFNNCKYKKITLTN